MNESAKDPVIITVIHYVQFGWPLEKTLSLVFDPYKNCKVKISTDQGCLIWGNYITISNTLQMNMLGSLHEAQLVMSRMKWFVSSHFWWTKVNEDIEK